MEMRSKDWETGSLEMVMALDETLISSKDLVMELLVQVMAFLETSTESEVMAMVSEDQTMESMETQISLTAIKTELLEAITKFWQAVPYYKEMEAILGTKKNWFNYLLLFYFFSIT